MTLDSQWLNERLAALAADELVSRYLVAFSGGCDSTVLLHALLKVPGFDASRILAVHVDHGLQAESADWTEHCRNFAADLGVDFESVRVDVDTAAEGGVEAAARAARYEALEGFVESDDWLLSAHHRDDQAETLLLNLMRGSGPAGLAGIGSLNRFSDGWLARPLIEDWMERTMTPEARAAEVAEEAGRFLERLPALISDMGETVGQLSKDGLRLHPESVEALLAREKSRPKWGFWAAAAVVAVILVAF